MKTISLSLALLLCLSVLCVAQIGSAEGEEEFTLLWDQVQGYPIFNTDFDLFQDLCIELLNMGASVKTLEPGDLYSDEVLKGVDIVFINSRYVHMTESEQFALVRFVQQGGSLLVMIKYSEAIDAMNPLLVNFGIQANYAIVPTKHINNFRHPATTERAPVNLVAMGDPRSFTLSNDSIGIGGYTPSAAPAAMQNTMVALGGGTAKGRVIAISVTNQWLSAMPFCGYPMWGHEDNTAFLYNVMDYLRGASDLKLKKIRLQKSYSNGKKIRIKARVQNLEYDYNRTTDILFVVSRDQIYQANKDTVLGTATVQQIPGRKSRIVKFKTEFPSLSELGTYYIIGIINPNGDMVEINSQNNTAKKKISVY